MYNKQKTYLLETKILIFKILYKHQRYRRTKDHIIRLYVFKNTKILHGNRTRNILKV